MITRNRSARNYHWRVNLDGGATYNSINATGATCTTIFTLLYGKDYAAGTSGIRIVLEMFDDGAGTTSWTATLITPWAANVVVTDVGFLDITALLEMDDAQLTMTCSDWELSFSELRWFVNGNLEATISAQVDSDTGCDLRFNAAKCEPTATFFAHSVGGPPCGLTRGAQLSYSNSVINNTLWGWQWWNGTIWVSDSIDLPSGTTAPSVSGCTCTEPILLAEVTQDGSWEIEIEVKQEEETEIVDLDDMVGNCAAGPITPTICQLWRIDYKYDNIECWINGATRQAGIKSHRHYTAVTCDGNSDTTDATGNEPHTKCEIYRETGHSEVNTHCFETIQEGDCEHLPPPVCGEGDLVPPTDYGCTYSGVSSITWPTATECCAVALALAYDVGPDRVHWRGSSASGALWLGRGANGSLGWSDFDVGVDVDGVRLAASRTRKEAELYGLYKETGGSLILFKSTAGESVSTVLTVGAYSFFDIRWCKHGEVVVAVNDAGTIKLIVYDSREGSVRTLFSTGITDAKVDTWLSITDYVTGAGEWRLAIAYVQDGLVSDPLALAISDTGELTSFTAVAEVGLYEYFDICGTVHGEVWVLVNDAGSVRAAAYDRRLAVVRTLFLTNIVDALPDSRIAIDESVGGQGAWRLGLLYTNTADEIEFVTSDVGGAVYS